MMRFNRSRTSILTALMAAVASTPAGAVPYASAVRNTSGSMYEFVLNEAADSVTINFDVGAPMVINNPVAGRHTFDLSGASTFEIAVAKNAPVGWEPISDPLTNRFELFERPNGLVINNDPAHAMFGTIYVINGTSLDASVNEIRTMGDGVYAMTADRIGVDLANNFAAVTDPDDASQAKAPGWTVDNTDVSLVDHYEAAWKASLDEAGNLIVSDMSNGSGGIKWASPDLSTGGLILAEEDGILPLLTNGAGQEMHGSITSKPYVTGSVGNNLVVFAMDEDYDVDGDTLGGSSTSHNVWRWDVGSATSYDQPPELVIDMSAVPPTSNGDSNFLASIPDIHLRAEAHYEPQFDKWYLTERRSDGIQAGFIIVTADGVDGSTPTLEWSSYQFSIDNNLDGFMDDGTFNVEGLQDIFRLTGDVEISPDGTTLYLHRNANNALQNPYLGLDSPNGAGEILIIPLDENGLPVLEVDDNGTPEDPLDDVITNIQSIDIAGTAGHDRQEIELDAAGNVYITNNATEFLEVFSPGGNTLATTTSDGTFNVQFLTVDGLVGDYNGDGVVGAADYTEWRDTLGDSVTPGEGADGDGDGEIGPNDYVEWKANFGATAGSGSAAVPEPTGLALMMLAVSFSISRRNRIRSFNG